MRSYCNQEKNIYGRFKDLFRKSNFKNGLLDPDISQDIITFTQTSRIFAIRIKDTLKYHYTVDQSNETLLCFMDWQSYDVLTCISTAILTGIEKRQMVAIMEM